MPSIDVNLVHGPEVEASPNTLAPLAFTLELPAGTLVGRYQIVEKIATGGMGVVFRAYDPKLSRYVALKRVRPSSMALPQGASVDEHEQQLLREARALARLSHPNVVAAFDVCRVAGELFIAMALIDGVSLRTWLTQAARPRAEVVRIMLDAGRGLSAAHRAGVVHRDFKLANVMVSTSGHVQVVDFGLARTTAAVIESGNPREPRTLEGDTAPGAATPIAAALTRADTVIGTAGYIAPEQLEGRTSDERSDQFSYASAVFRALTGESPYPADSLESYRSALREGARAAWPRSIPHSLRRVVERGLSRDPGARYPSLDALLDDLERAARPPRRQLMLMAAGLALSVAALSAAARERFVNRCELDAHGFDQTWNTAQRARIEGAFRASGNPRAASTFGLVDARLADYRVRWQSAKQEACVATHVRRDQPEQILQLRYACLDRKRTQLGTLLRLLQQPDAALVDRASEALDAIAQLRDCSDVALLVGESERLPDDPARRAQIGDLVARSDGLDAVVAAGRWSESLEQASALASDAERASHRPIQARAMARALQALERLGRRDEADGLRRRTLEVASEAGVHDVLAQLAVRLLLLAVDGARWEDAKALLPLVHANVGLAGRPPALQIRLLTYEAAILIEERQFDAAVDKLQLALTECRRLGKEGARSCLTPQRELALVHDARHDYATARIEIEAAVEIAKQAYGPSHPSLLNEYNNLGFIAASWGDVETAERALAESKALAASLPENKQTANIPYLEGLVRLRRGDARAAVESLEDALQRRARAYGEKTAQVAVTLNLLSVSLASLGRTREAVAALERAAEVRHAGGLEPLIQVDFAYRLSEALWAVPELRTRALERARVVHALLESAGAAWAKDARSVKDWLDAHRADREH